MESASISGSAFESAVVGRFGIFPNFFRSAKAAPELLEQLWGFAKAGYLDNPMRYCIVRHVGFLLGAAHGFAAGDANAAAQTIDEVISLLRRPSPWSRNMTTVYASLDAAPAAIKEWPSPGSRLEDEIFACAAILFIEPARSESARRALIRTLGSREYELFSGCLAFIRTAHYWTMLHPEIETEDDMLDLLRGHEELARLLLEDPEADRSEMSERMFGELTQLREMKERQELKMAKQVLEEKDRQKDQFIAVLAHELRNPLAAVRTAGYALRRLDLQDKRAAPLIERVERQTSAIARMLEDLLDASRIAFGKVSVRFEPFELQDLLREAFHEQEPHARHAGLQLTADIPDEACIVNADRMRTRQIVDNLFSNAIKFTPAGGGVNLALATENDTAVISLSDTGIGFDNLFAEKLFEPFVQHEQGRDRSSGGLGLGLAIAARLAGLQGGSLTAASPGLGRGAQFTLTIPVAAGLNATPIDEEAAEPASPKSVLLVDDNKDLADGIADLLRLDGVHVRVAHDGPSAIRFALEAPPDILLCDLGLPGGMDGFEVARACRAEASLRRVRIVATSGYSSAQDLENAASAGFESLLIKPLTEESLRSLLR
jgi:signal transduction histidine kinase